MKTRQTVIGIAVLAIAVFLLAAAAAQAAPGVPYTFHDVDQETFTDEGLCTPEATLTVNGRYWLHANATQAASRRSRSKKRLRRRS